MPISGNIYSGLRVPRESGFATLGDFWNQFQEQRDRREDRALKKQDRELRQQEIDLKNQTIQAANRKAKTDEEKIAAGRRAIEESRGPDGLIDYEMAADKIMAFDSDTGFEFLNHLDERRAAKRKQDLDEVNKQEADLRLRKAQLESDTTDLNRFLNRLATATPESWTATLQEASEAKLLRALDGMGIPRQFSEEGKAQAANVLRTQAQRDALDKPTSDDKLIPVSPGTVILDPKTKKPVFTNPARESIASEPMESVIDPKTGKPVLRRRSAAEGMQPATVREQVTEDERKSAGFYGQMKDAIAIIDELEDQLSETDLYQIQSVPQEELIGLMNRGQMSEAAKRYLRAFEQFTEARLRPVSGAAIADSEYARDRRTYAKQYGETPQLSADRRKARNSALDSLRTRASRALPKPDDTPAGTKTKIGRFDVEVVP